MASAVRYITSHDLESSLCCKMAEGIEGKAAGRTSSEGSDPSVAFLRSSRRKSGLIFHLKEEVEFRMEPLFIESICGIVGQPNTGRRLLADRFGKLKEGVIERRDEYQHLWYCGELKTASHGRRVKSVIKAYIIPPPYTEPDKTPAYVQASRRFCCILFAFDVTRPDSFDAVRGWIKSMKISMPNTYFLVGNKCDLRETVPEEKQVKRKLAEKQAKKLGAAAYFECSAKYNLEVKPIMEAIVKCECNQPHV